jgi:hypothetical protein
MPDRPALEKEPDRDGRAIGPRNLLVLDVDGLLAPIDLELETLAFTRPSFRAGWPVVDNRPGFDLCSTTNDEVAIPATQRLHDR